MPYEGEYAHYQPLKRIVESERVRQLLRRSRVLERPQGAKDAKPTLRPDPPAKLPALLVAIDGSTAEVDVKNGYPGAKVGYCSVASVVVDLAEIDRLDINRPVNPVDFRRTEMPSSDAAALPGCNVITRDHISARDSFRESIFELLHDAIVDEEDHTALLETYQSLLDRKPSEEISCPYSELGCARHVRIGKHVESCPCEERKTLYPTDALRIHERFYDESGTNAEAFSYVMQIWEKILLVHLLRCFENRNWLGRLRDIAFFVDGPLAVFGPPAWLSAAIGSELRRLNKQVSLETGNDLIIVGVEKTGNFVSHFEEIDKREDGGAYFPNGSYLLLTDHYIKQRVIFSDSPKRYGEDTYFGRKLFYKTSGGARIVANIPFLTPDQDTLLSQDVTAYPQFPTVCTLLDKLVTSRFANALSPLVSAHAQAAIPLHLGQKVLRQLAQALIRKPGR